MLKPASIILTFLFLISSVASAETLSTLSPVADASLLTANGRRSNGREQVLMVNRRSPALMRFTIGSFSQPIEKVMLMVSLNKPAAGTLQLRQSSGIWRESAASLRRRPQLGRSIIARKKVGREDTQVAFRLPARIYRNGTANLALTVPGRERFLVASRETDSGATLEVYLVGGPEPIPTPVPTPTPPASASLLRGPYLQKMSPTSVIIRWRTSNSSDSVVRFGASMDALTGSTAVSSATTEHRVELSNLLPSTAYYYTIGSSSAALPADPEQRFVTPPETGTQKATRIWVLGDPGTGDSNAKAVRDAYSVYTGSKPTDLWLMLGDNAYETGSEADFQKGVFNIYQKFLKSASLWPVMGNHEMYAGADSRKNTGPYYNMFSLPRNAEAGGIASGTEAYYSFNYANIHFVALESCSLDLSPTAGMANWLKNDLSSNQQPWTIVYFHNPPYSKGSHSTDNAYEPGYKMRENILPVLESNGVDLVLTGHSHAYERSYFMNGHYGLSSTFNSSHIKQAGWGRPGVDGAYRKAVGSKNSGTVYVVAGSSGKLDCGSFAHPAMQKFSETTGARGLCERGSVVIDVDGLLMKTKFLDRYAQVRDWFWIDKN